MSKTTYLITGLIFIALVLIGYNYLIKRNATVDNSMLSNNLSVPRSTPTINPLIPTAPVYQYTNNVLGLSTQYPLSYKLTDKSNQYKDKLLAVFFSASTGKLSDEITLFVFPLKNQKTLQGWMTTFTTAQNTANLSAANNPYQIDQVNNVQYKTVNGKNAVTFIQGDPTTPSDSEYVTLIWSDKYIVFLGMETDKVGPDYQMMLSSLAF